MTLSIAENKKKILRDCINELYGLGYNKRTNIEALETEYDKLETALFNIDIPKTVSHDRVIVDDKTYKYLGYVE
jgi:hypothetical protein